MFFIIRVGFALKWMRGGGGLDLGMGYRGWEGGRGVGRTEAGVQGKGFWEVNFQWRPG